MNKTIIALVLSFTVLTLSFGSIVYSQDNQSTTDIHKLIQTKTRSLFDSLVSFRRDLHQHPELAGQEIRTAEKIKEKLLSLGMEVKSDIGGHGLIGILKGKKHGPVIAWRADIDAFKSIFPDPVEFPSKTAGVRHICGHDIHTTIGFGIAEVLHSIKNDLTGTIVFIFQPAEEDFSGANKMIEGGIFSLVKPEAVFSLHVAPLPEGLIAVKSNEVYFREKVMRIELGGRINIDEAEKDCRQFIRELSTVSDNSKYYDMASIADPNIGLSSPKSIYAKYLVVDRNFKIDKTDSTFIIDALLTGSEERLFKNALAKVQKQFNDSKWRRYIKSISFLQENHTVYNDPKLTEKSVNIIQSVYGKGVVQHIYGVSPFNNDDFAFFQEKVPGVYFFLGASDYSKGIIAMPHSPDFTVDEKCIEAGVDYFSSLLFEYLKSESRVKSR
ncbi:MAG: M20/M25/M40 family metallo-hydrolase [Bacteroidota bacterium]